MQPDVKQVLSAADGLRDAAVAALSDLVAVPSISARGEHLEAGARRIEKLAAALGFATELWSTPGAPVLFGHLPGPPESPTLLFYGHYDVQPPEPLDAWRAPPFEPTVRDGALYGRGAADNKGQLLAHLMAIRALQQCGDVPLSVKILVEGEEEIGSPHLEATVAAHRDQLACDLALTADGPVHDDGNPVLIFGVRGLLYLELRCTGANRDVHSGNRGGLVPTPAWELVHALASLRDADGAVVVPGFYDGVQPPTDAERQMLDRLPLDADVLLTDLGLTALPPMAASSPWETLMFQPTLNICGLTSGYGGPGAKTIVPSRATAKLDIRLVSDQTPAAVEEAIRRHLGSVAPGLDVEQLAAVPPSATAVDTPWADAVAAGLRLGFGQEPWRRPRLGGTTPDYVFTQRLGVPSLLIPYANPDMDNHAPNEKLRIDYLVAGIRASAAICVEVATAHPVATTR